MSDAVPVQGSEAAAPIPPIRHEAAPLRNRIVVALRAAIEKSAFVPGERLVEKDLCRQLDVSRTSLREALRQLQAEGLLVELPNRGLAVAELSRHDAGNIYRIRAMLESMVVEQFIELASAADMEALVCAADRLKAAYLSGEPDEITFRKRAFHEQLCRGARNATAFDILNHLTSLTSSLRRRSVERGIRQKVSGDEIDAIVAAIAARKRRMAQAATERHVANSARSALDGD